ncbi:2'-5' RNA ligase family protein [Devosia riboflavina]
MDIERDMFGNVEPAHPRAMSHYRSFFCLLPPPKLAQELEHRAERWARPRGVRRVTTADRLHISLNRLPDGELTAPELLDDAIEVGAAMHRASFDLCFDVMEAWNGPKDDSGRRQFAVVLKCSTPPRGAEDLYRDLRKEMTRYGLPVGPLKFEPHITVWYQHGRFESKRLSQPIRFRADRFWLVHSITGARRLEHIASWPLKF